MFMWRKFFHFSSSSFPIFPQGGPFSKGPGALGPDAPSVNLALPTIHIFPWQALPHIHSITGVIMPTNMINTNNNNNKTISANSRINLKINQHLTPSVDQCYCGRDVLFEKMCVCCLPVCLAWVLITCQTYKGNTLKHGQFLQVYLFGEWLQIADKQCTPEKLCLQYIVRGGSRGGRRGRMPPPF